MEGREKHESKRTLFGTATEEGRNMSHSICKEGHCASVKSKVIPTPHQKEELLWMR